MKLMSSQHWLINVTAAFLQNCHFSVWNLFCLILHNQKVITKYPARSPFNNHSVNCYRTITSSVTILQKTITNVRGRVRVRVRGLVTNDGSVVITKTPSNPVLYLKMWGTNHCNEWLPIVLSNDSCSSLTMTQLTNVLRTGAGIAASLSL